MTKRKCCRVRCPQRSHLGAGPHAPSIRWGQRSLQHDFLPLRLLAALLRLSLLRLKERKILSVSLFLQFVHGNKTQRGRVDTETFASRRRAVVKDVAQMRVAGF